MGKPKGKTYVSSGERPNVSRSLRNAGRRERRANPSVKSILQREHHRNTAIARKHDPRYTEVREKYIYEDSVFHKASELFEKYAKAGATWAACVQAVKTDWVSSFEAKMSQRLQEKGN